MRILEAGAQVFVAESPSAGLPLAEKHTIHGIVTRGKGDVNPQLIAACPGLEVISRCGVGLDNIDVAYATGQGVKVVNAPGSNADTVAEHTISLMLMLQRNLYNSVAAVKNKHWNFRNSYVGDEIRGKTLGIMGLGDIGKKVAQLATAFGMSVIYWGQEAKAGINYPFCSLDDILSQSDIVSLHLPLVPATRHLLNREAFRKMRPHALIINTARGAILDDAALLEALQTGEIGGFAADVLVTEPPVADDPLLALDNVLITPHSASLTARTYNEMCVVTVQNTVDLLHGKAIDSKYIFNRNQL